LLLSHELRRASQRLHWMPKVSRRGHELSYGDGRGVLEELFKPLPEGTNVLPSCIPPFGLNMGALFLLEQDSKGSCTVEAGIIETVLPQPGWSASFLRRSDEESKVFVRLLDVEEHTGRAFARKSSNPHVVLCPCHFICRVQCNKEEHGWRLDSEGLDRFRAMRMEIIERSARMQQHSLGIDDFMY